MWVRIDRSKHPAFPSSHHQVGACKVAAEETFDCLNRGAPSLLPLSIDSLSLVTLKKELSRAAFAPDVYGKLNLLEDCLGPLPPTKKNSERDLSFFCSC
jgi:hypothetical protein